MLHLAVSHLIHLTKEQCYLLHEGQELHVVGVSTPIWHSQSYTSEPGTEVFCQYILKNNREEVPIQILQNGYLIHMPYRPKNKIKPLTDEEWRILNMKHPDKLEEYYRSQKPEVSTKNLLEIEDGGSRCLLYREHNKAKKDEKVLNIMHFVNFERTEKLLESLV